MRAFLRRRLGILVAEEGDELDEALAVDLDGLQQWAVGDRLADAARLAGQTPTVPGSRVASRTAAARRPRRAGR